MKRFIYTVLSVFGILIGLNVCLDLFLSHRLQHCQTRKFVGWSDIIQTQLNADLLIIGNSRAWVQYDPAIIDSILGVNSYNLGIDGSPLNRQIVKYNVYRYYQTKPESIIVNIDCFSLTWRDGYEREQFFPYLWTAHFRDEIMKIESFSWLEEYAPVYRYTTYDGIYNILKESYTNDELYKGYKGWNKEWDGRAFNEIDSITFEVDGRTLRMFVEFLKECRAEGIKVIFCYAPIYSGVRDKISNAQEMYDTYQGFADEYLIPILNYTSGEMCSDTTFFYNAMHLNKYGAEQFSHRLALDLVKMGR